MGFSMLAHIGRNWRVIYTAYNLSAYLSGLDFFFVILCVFTVCFFCMNIADVFFYTDKIVNHSRHVDG